MLVWKIRLGESESRIALEKDSLEVWVNGEKIETEAGFTDQGSEMTFELNEKQARIVAVTSGKRREGILHQEGLQIDKIRSTLAKIWSPVIMPNRFTKWLVGKGKSVPL